MSIVCKSVNSPPFEMMLSAARKLPSLSAVVVEVMKTFEHQDIDSDIIANKINLDQAITSRVLRVANSAFFGLQSKVGSVKDAVVLIGLHNIRSLVIAAGLIGQFPSRTGGRFDQQLFWQHGIGTGVCARVLATRLGQNAELAFTAGLLHDIGRLVVEACDPQSSDSVVKYAIDNDVLMEDAEQSVLGFDHAAIGFEITRLWQFPVSIQIAIRDHHCPDTASGELADLVHVANVLCHALDIGGADFDMMPRLSSGAWQRLALSWEAIETSLEEIERDVENALLIMER